MNEVSFLFNYPFKRMVDAVMATMMGLSLAVMFDVKSENFKSSYKISATPLVLSTKSASDIEY